MIIEGCYFPYNWKESFEPEYLAHIRFYSLIMTPKYIENHFDAIKQYANVIEERVDDGYCTKELLIRDNNDCLEQCKKYDCEYILIDEAYEINLDLE